MYAEAELIKVPGTYGIYQMQDTDELYGIKFMPKEYLDKHGVIPVRQIYDFVYADLTKNLPKRGNAGFAAEPEDLLESLYYQFNMRKPSDFKGRSLSVSDVICINTEGGIMAYYVNDVGFVQIPEFAKSVMKDMPEAGIRCRDCRYMYSNDTMGDLYICVNGNSEKFCQYTGICCEDICPDGEPADSAEEE